MKNFLQWAEENNIDLSIVTDTAEPEDATQENTKRTGLTDNYPPAYSRGQYPKEYFPAVKATAALDLQQKANKQYGGQREAK
jgi:hypothetical protein